MENKFETYKIINDEDELLKFIDFLPELEDSEFYYFCLFARKKYAPESGLKGDRASLKRFTSQKKDIIEKIKQLEIKKGYYKFAGVEVPTESLVLYLMPNPRSVKIASQILLIELTKRAYNNNFNYNLHQEALTAYQKAKSRTCFQDFEYDVDKNNKQEEIQKIVNLLNEYLNSGSYSIVESRGGIHVLVDPSKIDGNLKKSYFMKLQSIPGYDKETELDMFLPVPGCTQGNFIPRLIKK